MIKLESKQFVTWPILPYAGRLLPVILPSKAGVSTMYTSHCFLSLSLITSFSRNKSLLPLSVNTTIRVPGEATWTQT